MKLFSLLFSALVAITVSSASHAQLLTESERPKALAYLESTSKDLLLATKGLTEAQLNFKLDSSHWSIKQCVEHITLAEIGIYLLLGESLKSTPNPLERSDIKLSDDEIIQRITNRDGKASAPAFLKPIGKFPTLEQALRKFIDLRTIMNQYGKTTSDNLRHHYSSHPVTGTIDAYQLILLMAAHSKRHTLQIEEVKSNPAFPKN